MDTADNTTLYGKKNTDEIFLRNVTAGLLSILNRKLTYSQIWTDNSDIPELITVPFFFNLGNPSSEDFIQNNYLFFGDKCGFKKINGNFDMIPRGMISLSSTTIQADAATNRWVKGMYQKQDPSTGKMENYVANLYSIPLSVTYSAEIHTSRFGEMLKVDQAFREYFYKNKTFRITYHGMTVPCRAGFPDSLSQQVQSSYSMGSAPQPDLKQTMDIQIETYQPVFDPSTEMKASDTIKNFFIGFHNNEYDEDNDTVPDTTARIYFLSPLSGDCIFSDTSTLLKWNAVSGTKDFNGMTLQYELTDDSSWTMIATVENHGIYEWRTPLFPNHTAIDTIFENTPLLNVSKEPVIRFFPDKNGTVSKDSVIVLDPGYFLGGETQEIQYVTGSFSWETMMSSGNKQQRIINFKLPVKEHILLCNGRNPESMTFGETGADTVNDSFIFENSNQVSGLSLRICTPDGLYMAEETGLKVF